ncbi:carboxypeptidase a2 [Plakobranchus ocellatus]|uniref:Carboxypeptidase a2 n=1 Tax=Plakobranchus ocellatus TaxID=259542 RepID=A0AAV4CZA7_9GAST|nr:carboxypeptidase a2 [Plakobranchus ocellatus]
MSNRLIDDTTKREAGQREKRAVISTDHNDIMDHSVYYTYTELHGNSSQVGDTPKPAVVIEAGIHAREWISPAVNLWVIDALIGGYRNGNTTITAMLDQLDWYIIPVTNPDGYQYSHEKDCLWRKNRRYIRRSCRGVNLNRNFDVAFNTTEVSNFCWSDIYLGDKPFSDPESCNVKALVGILQHRLMTYVAAHSFSQSWIGGLMASAMSVRHGTEYRTGQALKVLGDAASGISVDWALKIVPGIFAVGIEPRPPAKKLKPAAANRYTGRGYSGFLLTPQEIVPTAEEYFDGLVAMANELQ